MDRNERVLVCGGRKYWDYNKVVEVLDEIRPQLIIHGKAAGADTLADKYGIERGLPLMVYSPQYDLYGPRVAPLKRNEQMLAEGKPTLVVAFPGGTGTKHMVRIAMEAGVEVQVVEGFMQAEVVEGQVVMTCSREEWRMLVAVASYARWLSMTDDRIRRKVSSNVARDLEDLSNQMGIPL